MSSELMWITAHGLSKCFLRVILFALPKPESHGYSHISHVHGTYKFFWTAFWIWLNLLTIDQWADNWQEIRPNLCGSKVFEIYSSPLRSLFWWWCLHIESCFFCFWFVPGKQMKDHVERVQELRIEWIEEEYYCTYIQSTLGMLG